MVMSSKKIGKMVGADVDKALANIGASTKPDMKGGDEELKAAVAPKKAQSFSEAFKAARKDPNNKGTFTWFGKSYSTKMAGEGGSKAATPKASTPKVATTKGPDVSARTKEFISKAPLVPKKEEVKASTTKPKDNSFAARQTRKYGASSPGNVLRAIQGIKDFNEAGLKRDVITDAKFKAQQKAKGYAKGGKIDGCAIRGKTRAPMKKGK